MSFLFNMYQEPSGFFAGVILVSIWSLVWKGLGLWHAARSKHKGWYIAILILNTAGLLPIIYLIWFKSKQDASAAKKKPYKGKSSKRK